MTYRAVCQVTASVTMRFSGYSLGGRLVVIASRSRLRPRDAAKVIPEPGQSVVHLSGAVDHRARIHPSGICHDLVGGHRARCRDHRGSVLSSGCPVCWRTGKRNGAWPSRTPEQHALTPCLARLAYPTVRWPARFRQCGSWQQFAQKSRAPMRLIDWPLHHKRPTGAGNLDSDGATLVYYRGRRRWHIDRHERGRC